jgi:hypothetical protein
MSEPIPPDTTDEPLRSAVTSRSARSGEHTEPSALRCLGGESPSDQLIGDWRVFQRLPARALDAFYDLLKPSLGPSPANPDDLESQAQAYCRIYAVSQNDLKSALRCCGALLNGASRLALPANAFRHDLELLSADNSTGIEVLMSRYEEARDLIRQEMLMGTLFDHGKVLVGVDWRLDTIHASQRGADLGLPVALLTLRFREGPGETGRDERFSVYAAPEVVRRLRVTLEGLERQMAPSQGRHVTRED